jgi:hypothetical protein
MEENEAGKVYSGQGEENKWKNYLVRKPEPKIPLGRPRHRWGRVIG